MFPCSLVAVSMHRGAVAVLARTSCCGIVADTCVTRKGNDKIVTHSDERVTQMTDKLMTRRFSLLMTGAVMGEMTPALLAEGITETSHCGSDGVLVPGVLVWQNVTVTPGDEDEVTITAELLAPDHVPGKGEYAGDEVTESHIGGYIMGAEAFWYGAGDEFFPYSVTVRQEDATAQAA